MQVRFGDEIGKATCKISCFNNIGFGGLDLATGELNCNGVL